MDKLAKHGHQANKAALYGELCALLFAKSLYDEVFCLEEILYIKWLLDFLGGFLVFHLDIITYIMSCAGLQVVHRGNERDHSGFAC